MENDDAVKEEEKQGQEQQQIMIEERIEEKDSDVENGG